jgi:putative ABC transport system ATP-binding protein
MKGADIHHISGNANALREPMSNSQSSIALETIGVSKVFSSSAGHVVALRNVSFGIRKGEFVSIVGPSGSGKSTLLNIIATLDRPTYGSVIINGVNVFSLEDQEIAMMRNRLIGFIFQSYNLINRATVQRNVELSATIAGIGREERRRRALKIMEVLGIKNKAEYRPTNLSGGQQQRVAIARSLMNNPTIILADEPTGNLDTKTGNEIFSLLKMLSAKFRRTIVMVTHNSELAAATDRIIYIRDGTIEKEVQNN